MVTNFIHLIWSTGRKHNVLYLLDSYICPNGNHVTGIYRLENKNQKIVKFYEEYFLFVYPDYLHYPIIVKDDLCHCFAIFFFAINFPALILYPKFPFHCVDSLNEKFINHVFLTSQLRPITFHLNITPVICRVFDLLVKKDLFSDCVIFLSHKRSSSWSVNIDFILGRNGRCYQPDENNNIRKV